MSPDHDAVPTDFEFIIRRWRVVHRRLDARLAGCTGWTTFSGTSTTREVLEGYGDVEDNRLDFCDGAVRALGLRVVDPASRRKAIEWLDGRSNHPLDVPVIDGFSENRGRRTVLRHREERGQRMPVRYPGALSRDVGAK